MANNQDNSAAKPFTRHSSFAAVNAEIEKANQEPGSLGSTRSQTTNPARSAISIASTDQPDRSQSSRRSSRSDSQIPEATMPPPPQKEDDGSHLRLLEELDIHSVPKPFRNPHWKHNQRRNKNIKQILSDVSRKEASTIATQENSGAATPLPEDTVSSTDGESTPVFSAGNALLQPNLAQASRSLSKMVLEKNTKSSGLLPMAPTATYTNIAAGPSLTHQKRYCDITGLPTTYRDPKTGLRYYNAEIYAVVKSLGPGVAEQYLEARGAHTILK